jgi:hypothetical protein
VQRLSDRLPLKPLACETPLPPLPVHASYREDPTSVVASGVVDAILDFIGAPRTPHKAGRKASSKKSMN